ncbi:MAG: ArsR/SmtB family transcription factor [Francisellaceae bacterium]
MIKSEDIQTLKILTEICRLMGDGNRLRILYLCMEEPHSVGDIAKRLEMSQSLTSQHLRFLKAARLVESERRGKQVFYALYDEHIRCILNDMYQHWSTDDH